MDDARPFRRTVLYVPGYDPHPPRRYRELYRREGARQAAISGYDLDVAGEGAAWRATALIGGRRGAARIEVLDWRDIVAASMAGGVAASYAALVRTAWAYLRDGTLFRLARLRPGPVIAALYPVAVLLAQAGAALALVAAGAAWLGLPGAVAGALAGWALLVAGLRWDRRVYAHYLMRDYAFTASAGGAHPPALEARIGDFAERIRAALAGDADEVLVVGHSSGAQVAVSAVADALRGGAGGRPALALLTLGQAVPMSSFLPGAGRLRADLALLARSDRLTWVDVSAPGDGCAFALCDPAATCGAGGPDARWPLVVSAAFSRTLSEETRRALRRRWHRLHFQYLCAFDRPGAYDWFAITAGPVPLAERFRGRAPSPGRIGAVLSRHTDREAEPARAKAA